MKKTLVSLLSAFALAATLTQEPIAQPAAPPAKAATSIEAATKQSEEAKNDQLREQGEGLIYSVARTPERTFDTSRAVEVITGDEILRRNGITLGDLLQEEAGVTLCSPHEGASAAVIRGLSGNQVMLMIDGVKVNNGTWSESSATGDHSIGVPIQLFGQNDKLRYTVGGTYLKSSDLRGGEDIGTQKYTSYKSGAVHASIDYFLSPDKTISAGYNSMKLTDIQRANQMQAGTNVRSLVIPLSLQLGQM